MARIAGVNVPENKHLEIALTHIYGIGRHTAQKICNSLEIDISKKLMDMKEDEIEKIRDAVSEYITEGDLRREISTNIKRLMDLGTYRGIRLEENYLLEVNELKQMLGPEKDLKNQ